MHTLTPTPPPNPRVGDHHAPCPPLLPVLLLLLPHHTCSVAKVALPRVRQSCQGAAMAVSLSTLYVPSSPAPDPLRPLPWPAAVTCITMPDDARTSRNGTKHAWADLVCVSVCMASAAARLHCIPTHLLAHACKPPNEPSATI